MCSLIAFLAALQVKCENLLGKKTTKIHRNEHTPELSVIVAIAALVHAAHKDGYHQLFFAYFFSGKHTSVCANFFNRHLVWDIEIYTFS